MLRPACLHLRGRASPSSPSSGIASSSRAATSLALQLGRMALDPSARTGPNTGSTVAASTSASSGSARPPLRAGGSIGPTTKGDEADLARRLQRASARSALSAEVLSSEGNRKTPLSIPSSSPHSRHLLSQRSLFASAHLPPLPSTQPSLRQFSTSSAATAQAKLREDDSFASARPSLSETQRALASAQKNVMPRAPRPGPPRKPFQKAAGKASKKSAKSKYDQNYAAFPDGAPERQLFERTANLPDGVPEPIWNEQHIRSTYGKPTGKWVKRVSSLDQAKSNFLNIWPGWWRETLPGFSYIPNNAASGGSHRVAVWADPERTIMGVGDGKSRTEAECNASLSAILQLCAAGKLTDNAPHGGNAEALSLADPKQLFDYDRARMFIEFYTKEFKFAPPSIDHQSVTGIAKKRGKKSGMGGTWISVMSINGQTVGDARAGSKKISEKKVYITAAEFLCNSDPTLLGQFEKFEELRRLGKEDLGLAPPLNLHISDALHSDIAGLCEDIAQSNIYRNVPTKAEDAAHALVGPDQNRVVRTVGPLELKVKSESMSERLNEYMTAPVREKMRATRQSLPVFGRQADILSKIQVNDVTIVMAQTGSGKTTQIPQILLDDWTSRGEGARCNILCTQPRRIAATSVAARIADERGQLLGDQVGYQVRFDARHPQPNGSITLLTTGIFLRRMQSALGTNADPVAVAEMDKVSHIIVDEAHERDIDTDLSLVVLKRLIQDRRKRGIPLKVILMSATIDPTLFQKYFTDPKGLPAPVAEVPGRTFPVERFYLDDVLKQLPSQTGGLFNDIVVSRYLNSEMSRDRSLFGPDTGMDLEIPYPLVALTVAHALQQSNDGHVLVFLPGWDEIKKVETILTSQTLLGLKLWDETKYTIHKLHSSIPKEEQDVIFTTPAPGVRRIVLSTNVAESSVTIPDVVYVVDAGRVKETRYDPGRRMSSLVSAWAGKSNLHQRAGRAGRHREGVYYGLMSHMRYEALASHQTVEMKREDLSNVVMHVKALNFGDITSVLNDTIEPPEEARIVAAIEQLQALGALDDNQHLTSLGRILLQLPTDAATGKLVLYGSFFRCLEPALTLAAVQATRDPFLAPLASRDAARAARDAWSPRAFRSDLLTIVAAYRHWQELDSGGRYREAQEFCFQNFLSRPTMLQIKQHRNQILDSLDKAGVLEISSGREGVDTANVWRSYHRRAGLNGRVPDHLNENAASLPLLAALLAMTHSPNFAVNLGEHLLRTRHDKNVTIAMSSVNSPKRVTASQGNNHSISAEVFQSFERRLYAFVEKANTIGVGMSETAVLNAPKSLRGTTRIDPMTYLLFGAAKLQLGEFPFRGMICDEWLPIKGHHVHLGDLARLRELMDGCILRVFEGLAKMLGMSRHERERHRLGTRAGAEPADDDDKDGLRGEREAEDGEVLDEEEGGDAQKRAGGPLTKDEIKEFELLTMDVVRVLDCYALERQGTERSGQTTPTGPGGGHFNSRPNSRAFNFDFSRSGPSHRSGPDLF